MKTVERLQTILGSTYVLQVKTQNFHWNYEGPHFPSYHEFFEEQYDELREAVDELAERIRQLGSYAPGSMAELLKHSSLKEADSSTKSEDMVRLLRDDHKALSELLEEAIADENMDEGTKDMLIARQQAHDKHHWMLASTAK